MKVNTPIKLSSLLAAIKAEPLTELVEVNVTGCYIGDLLSDVLAHAQPGMLWVTIQTHRNVISAASMKDITAVLFASGRKPDPSIVAEAEDEKIALLTTPLTAYEAASKLWEAGLR
jgi:hypothetical protein